LLFLLAIGSGGHWRPVFTRWPGAVRVWRCRYCGLAAATIPADPLLPPSL